MPLPLATTEKFAGWPAAVDTLAGWDVIDGAVAAGAGLSPPPPPPHADTKIAAVTPNSDEKMPCRLKNFDMTAEAREVSWWCRRYDRRQ